MGKNSPSLVLAWNIIPERHCVFFSINALQQTSWHGSCSGGNGCLASLRQLLSCPAKSRIIRRAESEQLCMPHFACPKAALWDIDGTLIDTTALIVGAL